MSWFIAYTGPEPRAELLTPSAPLFTISTPSLRLIMGGIAETCHCEYRSDGSSGWAVVGTGIRTASGRTSIMSAADWRHFATQRTIDVNSLDGHFVLLKWTRGSLECLSDQLGLRTAYFAPADPGTILSSRLDLIAPYVNDSSVDFRALGSCWTMFHQQLPQSYMTGVHRLGAAGHVVFRNGIMVEESQRPWTPEFGTGNTEGSIDILRSLVDAGLTHASKSTLGLSGGLDSRLLLAVMSRSSNAAFATHTFGQPDDPDVRIAQEIAHTLHVPNVRLDEALPSVDDAIRIMRTYVAQTNLTEPCSSFLKLRYYRALRHDAGILIDGGFGEIVRRQYFNRFVKLGRAALRSKNMGRLTQLMSAPKADVFTDAVTSAIHEGATESLRCVMDAMPPIDEIGMENYADLLAVRTRIQNYGSPEQARLDGEIQNYMPLVQPSFLRSVFAAAPKRRADARLHLDAIRRFNPVLAQFPLAKGGFTHRFGLSTNSTWLTIRIKSKIMKGYVDAGPQRLFGHLHDFVYDTTRSLHVRNFEPYDLRKVHALVDRFYRGDSRSFGPLNWWLTFELWRQAMTGSMPVHAIRSIP